MLKFMMKTWYYNAHDFKFQLQPLTLMVFPYLLKLFCSLIKEMIWLFNLLLLGKIKDMGFYK
jgi:hypothetical protein